MINVALIGYGYWGAKLARNFQNSEYFNLVSVYDKKKKRVDEAKDIFKRIQIYKNIRQLLDNKRIDLIIISTPTSTHYKLAKQSILSQKNVLVEKPLSLSLKEVKNLETLAKLKNKKIFVDYPFLFVER